MGGAEECWIWRGAKSGTLGKNPYGEAWINGRGQVYAHRMAWELTYGAVPKGLCVLHQCDRPLCVNPLHLWLGTKADNTHDAMRKGRFVYNHFGRGSTRVAHRPK